VVYAPAVKFFMSFMVKNIYHEAHEEHEGNKT